MGSEWKDAKLGDYIDSCLGKMLDKNKNTGEFHPYLGNSNVRWGAFELDELSEMKFESHEHERYGIKKGDLIVCEGGEPGRCAIWNEDVPDMKIQKALHRVRTLAGLDGDYLYYWFLFSARAGHIDPYFTGTTIKHLTGKALKELPIKIPPMRYQQEAAKLLRGFDNKITLNRQINQTLEQMAQTLFKSWFVDFAPVMDNALDAGKPIPDELQHRAEARKAVRESQGFKPLPDEVRQLFPDAFEESELGWVPKGWETKPISSLINLIGGGTPKTSEESYWGGEIPWFSVVDAPNDSNVFVLDTEKKVTEAGVANSSTKVLRVGTTIISARGTVGKCALVATPMAMNQSCYGVVGAEGVHDYFVYYLLRQSVKQLQQRSHGSVFSTITRDTFSSLKLATGNVSLTQLFGNTISPWFEKILANNQQQSSLERLRDTLLPKLISGELRLDDVEAVVEQETVSA
ncbi:restriction endonuclease subunit S [Vibrio navarrensis]|nr:restriction endonuclease subunit S [Vibrio navarrensis]